MQMGFSVNVPLPPYTDDEIYVWAFWQVVPPLLERYAAEVLVTQLGVDTHHLDPLARLALTTQGQETVFRMLSEMAGRWVVGGTTWTWCPVPGRWRGALWRA